MKKYVATLAGSLALLASLSMAQVALADEAVPTTTSISVEATTVQAPATTTTTDATVVAPSTDPEPLDGIKVEEPKNIPSGFGLWWKNLTETVSLGLTFDPVKKAQKQLQFAEEKTKLAQFMLQNSTDPKVQEKAQQLLDRANEYTQKLEEKKAQLADSNNPDAKKVLENISKHLLNKEKVMDKIEDKIPADKLEEFTKMREDAKARAEAFLSNLKNDTNVPQEVKDAITNRMNQMQAIEAQREEFRTQEKTLVDQIKQGNEAAKAQLETLRQTRQEEVQKLQDEFKAKRQEIEQKIKDGDKTAVDALKQLNQEQREKAQEFRKNLEEKAQEIRKQVNQNTDEARKQLQEKRQELEKKARELRLQQKPEGKTGEPERKEPTRVMLPAPGTGGSVVIPQGDATVPNTK